MDVIEKLKVAMVAREDLEVQIQREIRQDVVEAEGVGELRRRRPMGNVLKEDLMKPGEPEPQAVHISVTLRGGPSDWEWEWERGLRDGQSLGGDLEGSGYQRGEGDAQRFGGGWR